MRLSTVLLAESHLPIGAAMKSSPRFSFRKVASTLATFALAITGLSLGISPASAATYHSTNAGKEYTVVLGDTFNMSFLCTGDNGDTVTDTNYRSGSIPTGMTWNTGVLSGTATAIGDFTFGDWQCLYSNGSGSWQGVGGADDWTTVHVAAPSTPTPSLTATNLNNANCDVRVVGVLPATPDPGSAILIVADTNSSAIATLVNFDAGKLIDITFSANDVRTLGLDPTKVVSISMGGLGLANYCGNEITITLAYQHFGASPANATTSVNTSTPPLPSVTPVVSWTLTGDSVCTVHLTALWPSLLTNATPHINIATSTFGYNIWLSGVQPNTLVNVDLPLMNQDAFANGQVAGIDHYTSWGTVPTCDGNNWWAVTDAGDAFNNLQTTTEGIRPSLPPVDPALCAPGTFSQSGRVPCIDAAAGFFVDHSGATNQVPCNLGFFNPSAGSPFCTPAAKGTYVGATGSATFTDCPAGKTTALMGARSAYECYTQIKQTARGVRVLSVYKAGLKFTTVKTTDLGAPMALTSTGNCTVSSVKVVNKLNGKNVKVDRYQVALGKAGSCTLNYTVAGSEKYLALSIVKTFKITKTGK